MRADWGVRDELERKREREGSPNLCKILCFGLLLPSTTGQGSAQCYSSTLSTRMME
jgi:hypothetical protein